MDVTLERSTMRKVYLRLLPFAMLCYILAYIDRINVSFAGLTMRDDIGMSAGDLRLCRRHVLLGLLHFRSAEQRDPGKDRRQNLDRADHDHLGILAAATAFVKDSTSFAIVRFLLGVAEAGFFPGIILYFTYWFPANHHARIVAGFLVGLPVAVALGSPISTALLGLDGLFGSARLAGDVHRRSHSDRGARRHHLFRAHRPAAAGEIPHRGGTQLAGQHHRRASGAPPRQVRRYTLWEALYNPKVLLLALNYLGIVTASLGMLFFIPQIIKSLGNYSNMTVGWLTMIPYICGGIAMVVWGRISDRMNERRWNLFFGCVFSTVGPCDRRHDHGDVVGTGRHVDRRDGLLWLQGSVLRHAADVPYRPGARRRHCLDQLARQSRRLLRALVCRRHEGHDRQLRRRALRARLARLRLGSRVRAVPAHSEAGGAGGEASPRRRSRGRHCEEPDGSGPDAPAR